MFFQQAFNIRYQLPGRLNQTYYIFLIIIDKIFIIACLPFIKDIGIELAELFGYQPRFNKVQPKHLSNPGMRLCIYFIFHKQGRYSVITRVIKPVYRCIPQTIVNMYTYLF